MSQARRTPIERLAGAPISWGICEVPGWGLMLDVDRVLDEMLEVGMTSTELGSPGFLPDDPIKVREVLAERSMTLIGGFVPLVLQTASERDATIAEARRWANLLATAGGELFITAPVMTADWAPRQELSAAEMAHMCEMFDVVDEIVGEYGMRQVLHPHANTAVEQLDDVRRVLEASTVSWCLDTGHLSIGGTDPVEFARDYASRVGHVHLKDVDTAIAGRFNAGEYTLMEAVQHGLFQPLGEGDVAIDQVVGLLEDAGYQGLYVIEQDQALAEIPALGSGPVAEVRKSVNYLRSLPDGR